MSQSNLCEQVLVLHVGHILLVQLDVHGPHEDWQGLLVHPRQHGLQGVLEVAAFQLAHVALLRVLLGQLRQDGVDQLQLVVEHLFVRLLNGRQPGIGEKKSSRFQ